MDTITSVLSLILPHLEDPDLLFAQFVSKQWNSVIKTLPKTPRIVPLPVIYYCAKQNYFSILKWIHAQLSSSSTLWANDEICTIAASGNVDLALLQWLHEVGANLQPEIINHAAELGRLDIMKWARSVGVGWPDTATYSAASNGNFEVLQYLEQEQCPWSLNICEAPVIIGNFEILKWLREKGCPWEKGVTSCAALYGHFDILKWAVENGCPLDYNCCTCAAKFGNIEILKWLREQGCTYDNNTAAVAASWERFEVLRWVMEDGCTWHPAIYGIAARKGRLDILKWAKEKGYEWDGYDEYPEAVKSGKLEIVQWLYEKGCPWNSELCSSAASAGNLEILDWAASKGCPLDMWTCCNAAANGHLHVLKWAKNHGCTEMDFMNVSQFALDHLEILQWLWFENYPIPINLIYIQSAKRGLVQVLTWVRHITSPWKEELAKKVKGKNFVEALNEIGFSPDHLKEGCNQNDIHEYYDCVHWDTFVRKATKHGHLDTVKWFFDNGCPWNYATYSTVRDLAAETNNFAILKWANTKWKESKLTEPDPFSLLEKLAEESEELVEDEDLMNDVDLGLQYDDNSDDFQDDEEIVY